MHSSVQTGLFSQNLFGQQNNDHQYHNYAPASQQHRGGGGGQHQALPGPHNHHYYHFQPPLGARHSKASTSSRQDITASMVAIDSVSSPPSAAIAIAKSSGKLNMSSSNISKLPPFVFLSSTNLDKVNNNSSNKNIDLVDGENRRQLKNQSSSSSSIIGQIISSNNMTRNISANFYENNINGNFMQHHMSISGGCIEDPTKSGSSNAAMKQYNGSFWDCTKPCGMLTTALGIILLVTSAIAALVLLESSLCVTFGTCSNALVTLYAFSALVCGVVLVFIGLVIVIYTKKDVRVIVTTAKNFDKIVHLKQQQVVATNNSPTKTTINETNRQVKASAKNRFSLVESPNDRVVDKANMPLLNKSETMSKIMA